MGEGDLDLCRAALSADIDHHLLAAGGAVAGEDPLPIHLAGLPAKPQAGTGQKRQRRQGRNTAAVCRGTPDEAAAAADAGAVLRRRLASRPEAEQRKPP